MGASCAVRSRRLCHRASYDVQLTCCAIAPFAERACSQILDAPKLRDDFYMNVLDWSSQNLLAVGLGDSVYLWNAVNNNVRSLFWAHASLSCAACQIIPRKFAVSHSACLARQLPSLRCPLLLLSLWTVHCLLARPFPHGCVAGPLLPRVESAEVAI